MAKAKTKAAVKRKPAKARASVARAAKVPPKAPVAKAAKPAAARSAKSVVSKAAATAAARTSKKPAAPAQAKAEPLTLPKAAEAPVAKPSPVARVTPKVQRADLPPPDGFTLLVDGHFKNRFDDLNGAKAAASELKGRFPMLRIEIYDGEKKARLPA